MCSSDLRRSANLLYALLYLGPILTAGVLRLNALRSAPAEASPPRLTLEGFGILYVVLFALAVQFSAFKHARFNVPVYPFLFFFVALSLARCQEAFPRVQRKIQTVFLASVVVLGLGTHAPLLSLDRPGLALSTKGYSYGLLPSYYWDTHAPAAQGDRKFIVEVVQRPFLSDILLKLSADDQPELSRGIALLLGAALPFHGQTEDFTRIERLVPHGFDKYFYYQMGTAAMDRHPNELPKAVAAVEFLRHRTPAMHHLALVGIYRWWPWGAALDRTPEALANAPVAVAPELSPHYWRAIGHLAGRYWYDTDQSLSVLNARVQAFVPRLDPSVQKYFLQGVGEFLFVQLIYTPWVLPAEMERFPQSYQEALLEGWGMALGEFDHFSDFPWHGHESPFWAAWTKGLSAGGLVSVEQGKAQFEALFEGPALQELKPPRQTPLHKQP